MHFHPDGGNGNNDCTVCIAFRQEVFILVHIFIMRDYIALSISWTGLCFWLCRTKTSSCSGHVYQLHLNVSTQGQFQSSFLKKCVPCWYGTWIAGKLHILSTFQQWWDFLSKNLLAMDKHSFGWAHARLLLETFLFNAVSIDLDQTIKIQANMPYIKIIKWYAQKSNII